MTKRRMGPTGRSRPRNLLSGTLSFLLTLVVLLCTETAALPAAPHLLQTVDLEGVACVPLDSLAAALGAQVRCHPDKAKVEFQLPGRRILFTLLSSYVVINGLTHHLPMPVQVHEGRAVVVAEPLMALLLKASVPQAHGLRFAQQAAETEPAKVTPPEFREAQVDPDQWAIDVVVIDPGHGGRDPGALGKAGTREKDVVLKVAKRLQGLLERKLKVKAVLTRTDDTHIPLGRRAKLALASGGKIFVSLHCNAGTRPQAVGSEVFFLSEAKTAEAAEVARMENAALQFEDETGTPEDHVELEGIARGLLSTQFLKESQDLAADIRRQIVQHVSSTTDRGVKQANFYVMRGTMGAMPSVLVEMGFISNRAEERRLRSTAHQKQMAEAIFRGIRAFKQRYEDRLANDR